LALPSITLASRPDRTAVTAGQRRALKLVAAATALWMLALAAMALLTSNPPLISRDQLLQADAVVVGRIAEGSRDRIRIERVLTGDFSPDDVVTVLNWGDIASLPTGPPYLIPLTHVRQDYVVTVLAGQRSQPLIYGAEPETIGEVKRLLGEAPR
jgi:hypothetical protein